MTQIEFKVLPNQEALDYFRGKGYAPALNRFSWRDVWAAEHSQAFTVAKAMNDDVLKAIRDKLDEAMSEGLPLDEFKKQLTPILKEFGWWGRVPLPDPKTGEIVEAQLGSAHRLRTIYDTNIRTAYSAGRWARVQRSKKLMGYLTYFQVERPTKRDAHKPFHGVTLPVDHPFWNTHWPQNDWFCNCFVKQVSTRVMERDGLSITDEDTVGPMMETTPQINPRTGETIHVPKGIGPGFEYNPGRARFNPATGSFDPA